MGLSYFARAVPMVFAALLIHRLTSLPSSGTGLCPPHGPPRSACHFSEDYFEAREYRASNQPPTPLTLNGDDAWRLAANFWVDVWCVWCVVCGVWCVWRV